MFAFVDEQNKLLQAEQTGKTKDNCKEKEVVIAARVGEVEPNE